LHAKASCGQTSSGANFAACRAPLEKELEACKGSAANLLAFRPHSRAELAGKLTDKGYDHATIDAALSRIQDLVRPVLALPVCTFQCICQPSPIADAWCSMQGRAWHADSS
jgi:hypothetical protein